MPSPKDCAVKIDLRHQNGARRCESFSSNEYTPLEFTSLLDTCSNT